MKSVELMMCVLDFPIRGFSSSVRKGERSYGEFMALTIGLRGLCIFGKSYSLSGREFVGFNVNVILLEKLASLQTLALNYGSRHEDNLETSQHF